MCCATSSEPVAGSRIKASHAMFCLAFTLSRCCIGLVKRQHDRRHRLLPGAIGRSLLLYILLSYVSGVSLMFLRCFLQGR